MKVKLLIFSLLLLPSCLFAQIETIVEKVNEQQAFPTEIPAGEYSGITHIAADTFAVVSDKSHGHGFYLWKIHTAEHTGEIISVKNLGYHGNGVGQFDIEGVAFNPRTHTIFISQEADNSIVELSRSGHLTGRKLLLPDSITSNIRPNLGLESLCYDKEKHLLWTATEGAIMTDGDVPTATNGKETTVRLFAFNDSLHQVAWYKYKTDKPSDTKPARFYALGVNDIAAIGNGLLLILEREARVATNVIGSSTVIKVYLVNPHHAKIGSVLPKQLLMSYTTKFNFTRRDWANFEGMCLTSPKANGDRLLLFVADSQSQYKGVLKDWLKTAIIRQH